MNLILDQSETALHAAFAAPPQAFGPVPFWWWVGETLELDRLVCMDLTDRETPGEEKRRDEHETKRKRAHERSRGSRPRRRLGTPSRFRQIASSRDIARCVEPIPKRAATP